MNDDLCKKRTGFSKGQYVYVASPYEKTGKVVGFAISTGELIVELDSGRVFVKNCFCKSIEKSEQDNE